MCKESVQLEILKRSEIKKVPAHSLFYRNQDEKHFFFYLASHVLGQLQINQTNPFEALFMHRNNFWLFYK